MVNLPGEELSKGEDRDGKILMAHNGPAPPSGSGMAEILRKPGSVFSDATKDLCYFLADVPR